MNCGKNLKLDAYELINSMHINDTLSALLTEEKTDKFEYQRLSDSVNCFIHNELNSQGYFLLKPKGLNYILQAVHAHDDLLTGDIVTLLMQNSNSAKYATISSSSRNLLDASAQQTLSNAVAEKLIVSDEIATVVQIHGFSQERRKTRKAKNADIIVSAGDKESSYLANSIYQCLTESFDNTYLFGKNIYELGATENFLNLKLQDQGYDKNFIHIELSLPLRKTLIEQSQLQILNECFAQGEVYANFS